MPISEVKRGLLCLTMTPYTAPGEGRAHVMTDALIRSVNGLGIFVVYREPKHDPVGSAGHQKKISSSFADKRPECCDL